LHTFPSIDPFSFDSGFDPAYIHPFQDSDFSSFDVHSCQQSPNILTSPAVVDWISLTSSFDDKSLYPPRTVSTVLGNHNDLSKSFLHDGNAKDIKRDRVRQLRAELRKLEAEC
jgi:hypothetical protein